AYDFNVFELPLILSVLAVLYIIFAFVWQNSRRTLFFVAGLYAFIGMDLFLLRYYVTHLEPERLLVRHVQLKTPKLDQTVRILHISDIQAGSVGPYQEKIFDRIDSLEPDLIINTGDFLQVVPPANFEDEWEKLHALIERVNPRLGTYGVFGDTEIELYKIQPKELEPLVMLSSRERRIEIGSSAISLHGLSLYQSKKGPWAMRSVEQWLEYTEPSNFKILFGHAPDYATIVGSLPIDLCLAGHTHGGQVNIPFYGPLVIDSLVPKEWAKGFRKIGIPYLNVSAGAGSNRRHGLPPLRFNCPSEITLIELVPIRSIL
ncbi:MAG: metallophosphoesterase, partial [Verrucomicrobiota bacterium]|nr:metallophosphoesterase [Verrucomicrobiota bacterium]